MAFGKQSGRI